MNMYSLQNVVNLREKRSRAQTDKAKQKWKMTSLKDKIGFCGKGT